MKQMYDLRRLPCKKFTFKHWLHPAQLSLLYQSFLQCKISMKGWLSINLLLFGIFANCPLFHSFVSYLEGPILSPHFVNWPSLRLLLWQRGQLYSSRETQLHFVSLEKEKKTIWQWGSLALKPLLNLPKIVIYVTVSHHWSYQVRGQAPIGLWWSHNNIFFSIIIIFLNGYFSTH